MKKQLTQRQDEAYEFIRAYLRDYRKPPTLQEIGDELKISSSNAIYKILEALKEKGYIKREKHTARGITLVDTEDAFGLDDTTPTLDVISRTNSAKPKELHDRPAAHFVVDPYFLRPAKDAEACCIARAGDDGMNGDGIRKGDYLLIEEMDWRDVPNGELAACLIKDTMKVRRFEHTNGKHHLRVENRYYTDEAYAPDNTDCFIVGRVIGMMRRFEPRR
jgi:repressor LexA